MLNRTGCAGIGLGQIKVAVIAVRGRICGDFSQCNYFTCNKASFLAKLPKRSLFRRPSFVDKPSRQTQQPTANAILVFH